MKNQIFGPSQPSFSFTDAYLCVDCLETQLLYLRIRISAFKHLIALPHLQETCFLFWLLFVCLFVCYSWSLFSTEMQDFLLLSDKGVHHLHVPSPGTQNKQKFQAHDCLVLNFYQFSLIQFPAQIETEK